MDIPRLTENIVRETEKIIVGKTQQLRLIFMSILAEGHILLDDLPGVGKTTLIKTLAIVLGCDSRRIQFVPDLLPSDIVGMNIFDRKKGDFVRMDGPVKTNLLLADEINRAIPRTQSALLEAMEERQVTIDGETEALPAPFIVLATQNPVESESTFPLPAAQMDRFLIRLSLGYPSLAEEKAMLDSLGDEIPFGSVRTVTSASELSQIQKELYAVRVSDPVKEYLVALVQSTRNHPLLRLGASPRASRSLFKASKAWAAIMGRDFVTPDDIKAVAGPVLLHRLILTGEARVTGRSPSSILDELLSSLPVPPEAEAMLHAN